MTDDIFLTFDGTPITGKVPVQVRVAAGTNRGAAMAAAKPHLIRFHTELRIGGLQQLRRQLALPGGGSIDMHHAFGVSSIRVVLPPAAKPEGDFYGGILIRPTVLADKSAYEADAADATFSTRYVPEPFKSSGEVPGQFKGRPGLPGVQSEDATEWLVVQISKKKKLTPNASIKAGAVRIFRAMDPLHGALVEVNDGKQYLLSAPALAFSGGLDGPIDYSRPFPLSEFYYCGKRVSSLPPVPITLEDAPNGLESYTRIRTFRFRAPSFEKADQAKGVVIVAVARKLYAINTAVEPPPDSWTLLDDKTDIDLGETYQNLYGTDFTSTSAGGVVTLVCSGMNGAGRCSGFTVRIASRPDAPPEITGELDIAGRLFLPAVPASSSGSYTVNYQFKPGTEVVDSTPVLRVLLGPDVYPPGHPQAGNFVYHGTTTVSTLTYYKYATASITMAFSFTARSSVPKRMFDAFAGGPAPINPPYEVSVTWNKSESGAFKSHIPGGVRGVGWCMHDGVFGILLPDTTLFFGEPLSNVDVSADDFLSAGIAGSNPWGLPSSPRRTVVLFSVRETWTGALSASGGFAGPRNLSWTRTGTGEVAAGLTGDTRVDKPVVAAYTVNEARTVAGVGAGPITNDLTVRLRYETMDYHTQALALRSINEATGYWEAQAPLGANPTRASTVVYRDQFKLPAHVIDRSSKVLAGWDDIVARFSSVPVACLPRVNGGATMLYGMPDVPIAPPNEFTTGTTVAPADTAEFLSPFGGFYFVRAFDFDAKMDYGPRPYYSELPEYIPRTGTDVSLDAATAPQGRMTRAEFVGHYPASLFADPSYLPAIQYLQPGGQAMQGEITESYQVGDGGRPENLRARENILLRDLRNGGYIVQTHWLGERFDRTDVPFYETLIANESGAVRLVDVLNEWLALGENAVVMDHVFIDHPVPGTAVALL